MPGVLTIAIVSSMLALSPSQDHRFTFEGLGLDSDIASIAAQYPHSTRVGDYIYVAPEDGRGRISGIGLSGAGRTRRLRLSFESSRPRGSPLYPLCGDVQRNLEKRYGPPQTVRDFNEEASPRSDRIWESATEQMTLVCFLSPGRRTPLFAEAVVIAAR